jgi:carbonic anhydrase
MSHNSYIGDGQNVMQTSTISLFDNHIEKAKFNGWQFHFHSPSEHSIDG